MSSEIRSCTIGLALLVLLLFVIACDGGSNQTRPDRTANTNGSASTPAEQRPATTPTAAAPTPSATRKPAEPTPAPVESPPKPTPSPKSTPAPGPMPKPSRKPVEREPMRRLPGV